MKLRSVLFSLLVLVLVTNVASSCPVCFGASDSNMASAVNDSILVLLVIIGAVLSMFGTFILYLRKRMKLAPTQSINEQH